MLRDMPGPMRNEWLAYFIVRDGPSQQSPDEMMAAARSLKGGTWEDGKPE